MSNLRIAVDNERDAAVVVLVLQGDLDSQTYKELEQKANEVISSGSTNILLDLSGIAYMGSAGLRAFNTISNTLKDGGKGKVKLLNPSESVAKVLKTLGFDKFFEIFTKFDDALKSFK